MSYGVWRKRGKGWSSIEIDSPWNYTFYDLEDCDEKAYKALKSKTGCYGEDNPHHAQWDYGQKRKGRKFVYLPTGGEHKLTIAYDDDEAYARALVALKGVYYEEECIKHKYKGFESGIEVGSVSNVTLQNVMELSGRLPASPDILSTYNPYKVLPVHLSANFLDFLGVQPQRSSVIDLNELQDMGGFKTDEMRHAVTKLIYLAEAQGCDAVSVF